MYYKLSWLMTNGEKRIRTYRTKKELTEAIDILLVRIDVDKSSINTVSSKTESEPVSDHEAEPESASEHESYIDQSFFNDHLMTPEEFEVWEREHEIPF